MAFIDQQLVFSDAQVLTVTAVSTNVIDLGAAQDPGAGEPMWLLFSFAAVSGTGPTFVAAVKGADDAGITTNAVTKVTTTVLTPVANSQYAIRLFPGVPKRYWRVDYTIGGTTPSIATTAAFVKDVEIRRTRTFV